MAVQRDAKLFHTSAEQHLAAAHVGAKEEHDSEPVRATACDGNFKGVSGSGRTQSPIQDGSFQPDEYTDLWWSGHRESKSSGQASRSHLLQVQLQWDAYPGRSAWRFYRLWDDRLNSAELPAAIADVAEDDLLTEHVEARKPNAAPHVSPELSMSNKQRSDFLGKLQLSWLDPPKALFGRLQCYSSPTNVPCLLFRNEG